MGKKTEHPKVKGVTLNDNDSTLDDLLDKVDVDGNVFNLIDVKLSNEITAVMRGHYAEEVIYNYPRSGSGRKTWAECDLMKVPCPFKGKVDHVHIVGVGYQGALTAMRSYGQLQSHIADRPEIVEEGDTLYWAAKATVTDGHTGNSMTRWYMEPVLRKTKRGYVENEFGSSIAQSKALRNCILALIPHDLMKAWIDDYRSGKRPFSAETTEKMGYGRTPSQTPVKQAKEKTKQTRRSKSNPGGAGTRGLEEVAQAIAKAWEQPATAINEWAAITFSSPGRATLNLNRMLADEAVSKEMLSHFLKWTAEKEKQTSSDEQPELQELQVDMPVQQKPDQEGDIK